MAETQTTKPKPKRATTAKKAAPKASAAPKPAPASTPVQRLQDIAEKAVLVQVGAALIARDHVIEAFTSIAGTDVKTAERRGVTARTHMEGRVRKTRTLVEKELRTRRSTLTTQARKRVEHDVSALRADFDARTSSSRAAVDQIVETGKTVGSKVASRVPKVPTPSL